MPQGHPQYTYLPLSDSLYSLLRTSCLSPSLPVFLYLFQFYLSNSLHAPLTVTQLFWTVFGPSNSLPE